MSNDYRNTKYCPSLDNIFEKKNEVKKSILADHPKAKDMHAYISKNSNNYKIKFIEAYNCKCVYCGVSIDLMSKKLFEIDHFLYAKSPIFKSKKDAGYIENLVLACYDCNRNKNSFYIGENVYNSLHPDNGEIKNVFYRDENYYIKISQSSSKNEVIKAFYKQLKLGIEIRRLDYLLINLIGFQKEFNNNEKLYTNIGKIIDILRKKRNIL